MWDTQRRLLLPCGSRADAHARVWECRWCLTHILWIIGGEIPSVGGSQTQLLTSPLAGCDRIDSIRDPKEQQLRPSRPRARVWGFKEGEAQHAAGSGRADPRRQPVRPTQQLLCEPHVRRQPRQSPQPKLLQICNHRTTRFLILEAKHSCPSRSRKLDIST